MANWSRCANSHLRIILEMITIDVVAAEDRTATYLCSPSRTSAHLPNVLAERSETRRMPESNLRPPLAVY